MVPGTYVTAAEMQGFKKNASKPFQLHVADRVSFDLTLEIGNAAEEVTVTADAPLLRTADAQVGEVITNNFISNMPQLNRDAFALLRLARTCRAPATPCS